MDYFIGFLYTVMVVFILFAAYLTSRWFAVRYNNMSRGKYINVVERIALSKDKSIFILQVGQKVFLMGESSQGFSNISDLKETDLIPTEIQQAQNTSFKGLLNKYLGLPDIEAPEAYKASLNSLTELKTKALNSLNRMKNKHMGKGNMSDEG